MRPTPTVTVHLDKERHLLFNLSAMVDFEEASGISVWGLGEKISAKNLRLFLWACLRQEEPTLTVEQVGRMVHAGNMVELEVAALKAYEAAMPEPVKGEDGTDPKAAAPLFPNGAG